MPSKTLTDLVRELQIENAALGEKVAGLQIESSTNKALRDRVAVLESQVADLRKSGDESQRWNQARLGIALGAVLSLLGGIVVQLLGLRK